VTGPLGGRAAMDDRERRAVAAAVGAAMRSFEAAERALDAERLVAHFAPVPGFRVFSDGEAADYASMTAGIRAGFAALRAIEGGFHDLEVIVLAPDAALATAGFREAVTDSSGVVTRQYGAASWLWRRLEGGWRIVYGHADHRPDTGGT
jgi:ketosteroid isomerase-like protein